MTETDADSESEIKLTTDEIDGNESEIIPNITVMVDVSSNNTEIENVVDLSNQQYTLANPMYTLGGFTYDLPPHPYLEFEFRRGPTDFMSTSHNRYYFANGTFSSARLPNRKTHGYGHYEETSNSCPNGYQFTSKGQRMRFDDDKGGQGLTSSYTYANFSKFQIGYTSGSREEATFEYYYMYISGYSIE